MPVISVCIVLDVTTKSQRIADETFPDMVQ